MIQAKELRIGNFIYDDEGLLSKVIGFTPFDHSARCDEDEGCEILIDIYMPEDILKERIVSSTLATPIPLTPEILEACGFDPPSRLNFWELRVKQFTLILIDPEDGKVWLSPPRVDIGLEVANCPFLHQLQNLFFALTASELPVNLPVKA